MMRARFVGVQMTMEEGSKKVYNSLEVAGMQGMAARTLCGGCLERT
jgi:hypothetical protein